MPPFPFFLQSEAWCKIMPLDTAGGARLGREEEKVYLWSERSLDLSNQNRTLLSLYLSHLLYLETSQAEIQT